MCGRCGPAPGRQRARSAPRRRLAGPARTWPRKWVAGPGRATPGRDGTGRAGLCCAELSCAEPLRTEPSRAALPPRAEPHLPWAAADGAMSRGSGKGLSLKDKLDGNELDLSLCDLNEVPVRELAALPKATVLDLSCNNLISLPSDFCSLMHLVKLDLSKNRLQQLPLDFGRLVNLQHLDLLNNRLVTLPVSFAQLKNLKWLDLKDNPLDPVLAKVAGDCLDEKQCKQAAVKVLQHMKAIQSEQDQQRQRKLQAEREMEKKREAEQRAKEALERELRKREKAEEKERRRREYDAQKAAKQEMEKKTKKETVHTRKPVSSSRAPQPPRHKPSWSRSVLRVLLFVLFCILCTLAACKLTELQHQPLCVSVNTLYEDVVAALQNHKTLQNMLQHNSHQ